jgi:hypothetical protein
MLHALLNRHIADHSSRGRDGTLLTANCKICRREMVRLDTGAWRLSSALERAERDLDAVGVVRMDRAA